MTNIEQKGSSLSSGPTFLSPKPYYNLILGHLTLCQVLPGGRQRQIYLDTLGSESQHSVLEALYIIKFQPILWKQMEFYNLLWFHPKDLYCKQTWLNPRKKNAYKYFHVNVVYLFFYSFGVFQFLVGWLVIFFMPYEPLMAIKCETLFLRKLFYVNYYEWRVASGVLPLYNHVADC